MKTIEISGWIEIGSGGWSGFDTIKLIQEDGFKIDLVSRIKEFVDSFGATGQVNYWISDKQITKEDAIDSFLKNLYGNINAEYDKREVWYSTLTGGDTFYDTTLKIGGHDLFKELNGKQGKFMIFEMTLVKKDKKEKAKISHPDIRTADGMTGIWSDKIGCYIYSY